MSERKNVATRADRDPSGLARMWSELEQDGTFAALVVAMRRRPEEGR